jgi:hypothetical protein
MTSQVAGRTPTTSPSSTWTLQSKQAADRRRDIGGRQSGGRDLIKQRLEQVIVVAVNKRHSTSRAGESPGRSDAAEATPDNHHLRQRLVCGRLATCGAPERLLDQPVERKRSGAPKDENAQRQRPIEAFVELHCRSRKRNGEGESDCDASRSEPRDQQSRRDQRYERGSADGLRIASEAGAKLLAHAAAGRAYERRSYRKGRGGDPQSQSEAIPRLEDARGRAHGAPERRGSGNCGRDEAARQQRIDRHRARAPDNDPAEQNRPIQMQRRRPVRTLQRAGFEQERQRHNTRTETDNEQRRT